MTAGHAALVALFAEWRAYADAPVADGVADYTPETTAARLAALPSWEARLAAIATDGWTIPERVDWHLVRAEMAGLRFHLATLRPFARDPSFFAQVIDGECDTPAEEGPTIETAIRLWEYPVWPRTRLDVARPLVPDERTRLTAALATVGPTLAGARLTLATSDAVDLWNGGILTFESQAAALAAFRDAVLAVHPAEPAGSPLLGALHGAMTSTADFLGWLRSEAPGKRGPSGIGRDAYTRFLREVLLVPVSWDDEAATCTRELARAHATLRLEEHRNRALPALEPVSDADAFAAGEEAGLARLLAFAAGGGTETPAPWMEGALRERLHRYLPAEERDFFAQVTHRDPVPLMSHMVHWWDKARAAAAPHPSPIRQGPLRFNLWMHRAEGLATVLEEWQLHAGLHDVHPRTRELVWIMLAARAARGLGSLRVHANDVPLAGGDDLHVEGTPRGWMKRDALLGFEQLLYLRQPGYGPCYVTGARLLDEVLARRAEQLGDAFTLRGFFDELVAAGTIPISLLAWELTGDDWLLRAASSETLSIPRNPIRTGDVTGE